MSEPEEIAIVRRRHDIMTDTVNSESPMSAEKSKYYMLRFYEDCGKLLAHIDHLELERDADGLLKGALDSLADMGADLVEPNPCTWTEDMDGLWETACGQAQVFEDGGPAENDYKFCPYCAKPLVAVKYAFEPEDEDE